ncbi:MAG: pantoate--beta-alanine ligase [Hyphomicrobiaceae bacterium]
MAKRTAPPIHLVRTVADLRDTIARWRAEGLTVGLVPTMGALHEGHLSLARLMAERTDRVVVTIFVNPAQFGPNEDFDRYPRTEASDLEKLARTPAHLVFAPAVAEVYPPGFASAVEVTGPLTGTLEGAFRPGFFKGVATVVTKLLLQALPDIAVFGEKDFQQLMVIRAFVRDLDIPVEILGGPTIREPDGLAMSSRNAYLSPAGRAAAPTLHRVIAEMATAIGAGASITAETARGRADIEAAGFRLDYLEARSLDRLMPYPGDRAEGPGRVLVAAHIGSTRLIDNVPIEAGRARSVS